MQNFNKHNNELLRATDELRRAINKIANKGVDKLYKENLEKSVSSMAAYNFSELQLNALGLVADTLFDETQRIKASNQPRLAGLKGTLNHRLTYLKRRLVGLKSKLKRFKGNRATTSVADISGYDDMIKQERRNETITVIARTNALMNQVKTKAKLGIGVGPSVSTILISIALLNYVVRYIQRRL